jgi:hypothetical protein
MTLHSPMFLMKAGMAYEIEGKNDLALKTYTRIKKEFARTNEGREVDKYIAKGWCLENDNRAIE